VEAPPEAVDLDDVADLNALEPHCTSKGREAAAPAHGVGLFVGLFCQPASGSERFVAVASLRPG
jgi:hypothetical protein